MSEVIDGVQVDSEIPIINYQEAIKKMHVAAPEVAVEQPAPVIDELLETAIAENAPEAGEDEPVIVSTAQVEETTIEEATTPLHETSTAPVFNEAEYLKSTFGDTFTSVDAIKERLNKPAEPVFANEASKKLYEAVLSGKEDELAEYYANKRHVTGLLSKGPADIVKEGLKAEYGLTDAQAERRFSKMYEVDDMLEDEDREIEQKIIDKNISDQAEKYKEYFSKKLDNITFPTFEANAPASAAEPEETPEAKAAFEFSKTLLNNVTTQMGKVNYSLNEDNFGISISGQINLPKAKIEEIKSRISGNEVQYIKARYIKEDGTFDEDLFAQHIYIHDNPGEIAKAAAINAKNQTWKAKIKHDKNFEPAQATSKGDFNEDPDQAKIAWYRKHFNPQGIGLSNS